MVGGVDLLDASIKLLAGYKPSDFQMKENVGWCHLNFFLSQPEKEFRQMDYHVPPTVSCLEYYYTDGEIVRAINGSLEKVGYYIKHEEPRNI
ncbi:MAG: hypothetical protein IPP66_11880 [Anaerolineales bacterium]|nr:hypothetical protein [Anaerolineales bacterium]